MKIARKVTITKHFWKQSGEIIAILGIKFTGEQDPIVRLEYANINFGQWRERSKPASTNVTDFKEKTVE